MRRFEKGCLFLHAYFSSIRFYQLIFNNKEIVLPETLDLLKKLQQDPRLSDFFLVGGTALALQIGHRLSIDLDLFTPNKVFE